MLNRAITIFLIAILILPKTGIGQSISKRSIIISKDSLDLGIDENIFLGSESLYKKFAKGDKSLQVPFDICLKASTQNAVLSFFPQFRFLFEITISNNSLKECNAVVKYKSKIQSDFYKISLGDSLNAVLNKLKAIDFKISRLENGDTKLSIDKEVGLKTLYFEADTKDYHGEYIFKNDLLNSFSFSIF